MPTHSIQPLSGVDSYQLFYPQSNTVIENIRALFYLIHWPHAAIVMQISNNLRTHPLYRSWVHVTSVVSSNALWSRVQCLLEYFRLMLVGATCIQYSSSNVGMFFKVDLFYLMTLQGNQSNFWFLIQKRGVNLFETDYLKLMSSYQ